MQITRRGPMQNCISQGRPLAQRSTPFARHCHTPFTPFNHVQFLIGVLALLAGLVTYLVDRPPERVPALQLLPTWASGYGMAGRLPSIVGGSLPTFVHVLSFSLLVGSLSRRRLSKYALVCLTWLLIDVAFELGQGPGRWLVDLMPAWIARMPIACAIRDNLVWGTFDMWDILAACLGSATAFVVLVLSRSYGTEHS